MPEPHSTLREGAIAGVIGAAVIAFWYFVFDVLDGRLFATPNAIAERLFGVGSSDAGNIGTLAVVTVVHTFAFIVAGTAMTAMVHLAARDIAWRMGVLLALVIGLGMFAGLGFAANVDGSAPIPTWKVLGGALVAVVAMAAYLWRGHPELVRSFADVPLGDETDSVPHAPDR
jgi:hypothetical protein